MKNKILIAVAVLVVGAVAAFFYVTRAPSAPSQDVASATESIATSSSTAVYRISQNDSLVKFEIDEILRDEPFTAVGTTTQIAGDIAIGADSITIGTIKVNARTFKTDDERRDGAIARAILKSEDAANEFITFVPKGFDAETARVNGNILNLTITGDLTIAGVTKPGSFDVVLQLEETYIMATVESTVKRSDFGLTIPSLPFIAEVDDEVVVSANIVAELVTE